MTGVNQRGDSEATDLATTQDLVFTGAVLSTVLEIRPIAVDKLQVEPQWCSTP